MNKSDNKDNIIFSEAVAYAAKKTQVSDKKRR